MFTSNACSRSSFKYLWASWPTFAVYCRWVRGMANPADPISRLHDQFDGDLALAREAATRRVGNLWAFPYRKTNFLWALGPPIGRFVLQQAWRSRLRSYEVEEGDWGAPLEGLRKPPPPFGYHYNHDVRALQCLRVTLRVSISVTSTKQA